ncbi:MAG TPA: PQQ-binding-like beta-propeller repeat protein [Bryobacteraceae bacterium]|nr:PQQ-binding-like beta-propeller repeat protein [Bryobacteraceae bacterium]
MSLAVCLLPMALSAADVAGDAVYRARCANCHDSNNPRIPQRLALEAMPAERILHTLDYGVMIAMAYTMTHAEREAVASYLGKPGAAVTLPASAYCKDRAVKVPSQGAAWLWNGWSPTPDNARFQSAAAAGLTLDQVKRLKLKWAFGFDGDVTAFSQPVILGSNLFTGSASGMVYALDAATGCIRWGYQAGGPVRMSIVAQPNGSGTALLFGDQNGWFYALDAAQGKLLWKKRADAHDATRLTGSPAASNGIVYVPVASWEENRASDPKYECCTFRGSVVAWRIRDGSEVWKSYMIEEPKRTGTTSAGVAAWGPSGAGIWSAPSLDSARGALYVTTGDNYSAPATATSDAVAALDLKTGRMLWSHQLTADDIFSGGCQGRGACGPDFDFGSSAIPVKIAMNNKGRALLLAGQKSGVVYALDPERRGEIVWQTRVGKGSTNGGVQWGMASDGRNVYAAVSDLVRARATASDPADLRTSSLDPTQGGGLFALRIVDGSKAWYAAGTACDPPKPGCSPAQPAAVTAFPGVVLSGSVDGHLRAYSSEDGARLWDFDTAREFSTVNGVTAHGGSIDGPGAVVAHGMVYVNSGYSRQNGMPGNVLLAFGPE